MRRKPSTTILPKYQNMEKHSNEKLQVPEVVKGALLGLFPQLDLARVTWEWEVVDKIYEAEFLYLGIRHEVEISVGGYHLQTERNVPVDDVPETITGAVFSAFPAAEITDAEFVKLGNNDEYYEIDIKENAETDPITLHVRTNGQIVLESDGSVY